MAEQKMISEKEAVMRERAAYVVGASVFQAKINDENREKIEVCAARRYPLPKVTRPRVVRESWTNGIGDRYEWMIHTGENTPRFRLVGNEGMWLLPDGHEGGAFLPIPERVKLWADLLANPTEEVEDV